ncbi:tRNA pseudouridine(38-40) synthase TruA [Pantoea sp. SoEX]|uniref:tRNA pseudouridine(38-40) synthase TruA n=1 Tax=Pantoea sp. SoEX TaxID=2576763 RepID=UPI0013578D22|nr:tRNA pseudouridine(38-40) synthase TruA [Pantoea sp. SoEX]MXP50865.1 tRNA pseudouridine(38-40) synthase TruA [Pantoea sp. SoEX]
MCIEYDGSSYYGWQRQKKVTTVQETLEKSISKIANHSVDLFCAGRTDKGVHSTGQIVHFETNTNRNTNAWTQGVNSNLPNSIAVLWVKKVPEEFHARFSAIARRYRYVIYNYSMRPAILNQGLVHCYYPLNIHRMQYSSKCLLGENDFSAFCGANCQSNNFNRNIIHLNIMRLGYYVIIDIKANAFLYHMVRNIVGNLIDIGIGKKPESWMKILLSSRNRIFGCATAKAQGLYLVEVDYPSHFCLPKLSTGPLFLQQINKID